MKRHRISQVCLLVLSLACQATAETAQTILDESGVRGGIVVHLGCGDGALTAALRGSEAFTVHGLEADAEKVAAARRSLQAKGFYGPVSVEQHDGAALPYVDNLVNLVMVERAGKVSQAEVMRVLAPGGVAFVLRGGEWTKTAKPWPADIDEWGHFLHDASNNAVAADSAVAPPDSLQWLAPPLWLRSHETPSGIQGPVSAGGRLFYYFDEGLIGITDERLPDRWSLVCRDAFNGKLLWKRTMGNWGWRQWNPQKYRGKDWTTLRAARTDVPGENQRRIVAHGDRLYTTLAWKAPMSILEAATGEVIATVEATQGTREILVSDGTALAYTREETGVALVAVEGRTGKVLWKEPIEPIRSMALAIDGGRIVYLSGKTLAARALRTGRLLWEVNPKFRTPRTLLTVEETIVMQGGKSVTAHDARDGRLLWEKTVPPIGGAEGADLFVVDGLVWRGMLGVDEAGKPVRKSENALVIGWDLRTG